MPKSRARPASTPATCRAACTRQHIGDDTATARDRHFPAWRYQQTPVVTRLLHSDTKDYALKEILEIAAELTEPDKQKLLGLAVYLKNEEGNAQC